MRRFRQPGRHPVAPPAATTPVCRPPPAGNHHAGHRRDCPAGRLSRHRRVSQTVHRELHCAPAEYRRRFACVAVESAGCVSGSSAWQRARRAKNQCVNWLFVELAIDRCRRCAQLVVATAQKRGASNTREGFAALVAQKAMSSCSRAIMSIAASIIRQAANRHWVKSAQTLRVMRLCSLLLHRLQHLFMAQQRRRCASQFDVRGVCARSCCRHTRACSS